ncbi:hypothetical protein Lalb_Chr07g0183911 [Lupinus albus]|uniref:NFU1 iron-sulfur cluster protein n=1 Tax=Lupinus albus TaxID=3870 RepID=A0A6A4Q9L3_LUPAL|nr:hypothetical protein Lalb_Chr07g0183911 [Lupinus albus]
MPFRPTMGQWVALLNKGFKGGSNTCTFTTSTAPKMKASPTATGDYNHSQHQYQQRNNAKPANFVPIYVAIGMIAMATGLGLHTAWQQLRNSPTVRVKKEKRETLPEVVEPEHVAEEADNFVKKSFFRKVAHVQDQSYPDNDIIPDPIRKDAYAYQPRVETLKSVGVDPATLDHD